MQSFQSGFHHCTTEQSVAVRASEPVDRLLNPQSARNPAIDHALHWQEAVPSRKDQNKTIIQSKGEIMPALSHQDGTLEFPAHWFDHPIADVLFQRPPLRSQQV